MTPTTAAVIADSAPASALLPRSVSMNGAPRKIQRKHGANVTQVASRPPSVPASIGDSAPASRKAAMKPTNCSTMISGPGVVSAMPSPSSISPGVSQPIMLHRLLRHIGEHRVGAAERHHRHLGEEHRDLAEDVGWPEPDQQDGDRRKPQREPDRADASAPACRFGRVCGGNSLPSRSSVGRRALPAMSAAGELRSCPALAPKKPMSAAPR